MKFSYGTIVGLDSDIKLVEKRLDGGWFFKSYTIDEIFDHVQICLGVFPKEKFTVKVMPTKKNVQSLYKARYKKTLYTSAFMSKSLMTIWISAQDVTPKILAHEFAHCVFETNQYYTTSSACHEIVAQWVERCL